MNPSYPSIRLMAIAFSIFLGSAVASAKQWTPGEDADLAVLCATAGDGDTIALGEGTYRGPIRVTGKRLTIVGQPGTRPKLIGGTATLPTVLVEEKGEIELRGISIRTDPKVVAAVYVDRSRATIHECSGTDLGRFAFVDTGELIVKRCKISNAAINGIQAEGRSRVSVTDTTFRNVADQAIAVTGKSDVSISTCHFLDLDGGVLCNDCVDVEVHGSRFERVGWAIATNKAETSVRVTRNRIRQTTDSDAIFLAASGPIQIASNVLIDVPRGIGIQSDLQSSLDVDGNFVLGSAGTAMYIERKAIGSDLRFRLHANGLVSRDDIALVVAGPMNIDFEENVVLTRGDTGLQIQKGANARFRRNVFYGEQCSVYLHDAKLTSRLEANLIGAPVFTAAGPKPDAVLTAADVVLAEAGIRAQFSREFDAVFESESATSLDDLRPFTDSMRRLVVHAFDVLKRAEKLASISLRVAGAGGATTPAEFELVDAHGVVISRHAGRRPLAWVEPGKHFIRPLANPTQIRELSVRAGQEHVEEVVDPRRFTLQFEHYVGGNLKLDTLSLQLRDAASMQRCLTEMRRNVLVPTRRPDATEDDVRVALQIARHRLTELDKELESARAHEMELYRQKKWGQVDPVLDRRKRIESAQTWALRIMAVAGTHADANWLVKQYLKTPSTDTHEFNEHVLQHVGHLEARLGVLSSGSLASVASGDPGPMGVIASSVLHDWGNRSNDARLLKCLDAPRDWWELERAVTSLSDRHDVLVPMRRVVERYLNAVGDDSAEKTATVYRWGAKRAALYLLAFGDDADRAVASKVKFDLYRRWSELVYLIEDATPLVETHLGLRKGGTLRYDYRGLASVLPALRGLPNRLASRTRNRLEDSLVRVAITKPIQKAPDDVCALHARLNFDPAISRYEPNARVARLAFGKDRQWFDSDYTWIPRPWMQDQLIAEFIGGSRKMNWELLDHVPHQELVDAFPGGGAVRESDHLDLFLAYHRVATRAYLVDDPMPLGVERRPFVLCVPESSGAVSGIVELCPRLNASRLEVRLRLNAQTHYEGGFLPLPEEIAVFRGIVDDTDAERFSAVQLRRGNELVEMKSHGRTDGYHVFSTPHEGADLSGLTVDVTTKLGATTFSLSYDLFSSQVARAMRLAATP